MSAETADRFIQSDEPEPHAGRRREILNKYPGIKNLMERNPATFGYIILVLVAQTAAVWLVHDQSWWVILIGTYVFGAFANHACYTLLHDSVHGLVFKSKNMNRLAALLINLPTAIPSAISFQTYHLKHHAHQGEHEVDADMPRKWEITLFNHGLIGKSVWIILYSFLLALRSFTMKKIPMPMGWVVANYVATLSYDAAILYFFGWGGLIYLIVSTFFGLGLHPVGARWIQEHFVVRDGQETYSYYGPLNKIAFNVGYHNEHHDFPGVPWNNLPKVREIAGEYYNDLHYHNSWTGLLWRFLTDPKVTLLSRIERETRFGLRR
jgi:sphingolipid delta-4 desaturase